MTHVGVCASWYADSNRASLFPTKRHHGPVALVASVQWIALTTIKAQLNAVLLFEILVGVGLKKLPHGAHLGPKASTNVGRLVSTLNSRAQGAGEGVYGSRYHYRLRPVRFQDRNRCAVQWY